MTLHSGTASLGRKVLIVEDEFIISMALKRQVEAMGYEVARVADNARAALEAVERREVGLALMDVSIRGAMDGVEAARVLRDRYGIPVVILSAHSDAATLERIKDVSPRAVMRKPAEEHALRAVLQEVLGAGN